jgi:hypothetical protein
VLSAVPASQDQKKTEQNVKQRKIVFLCRFCQRFRLYHADHNLRVVSPMKGNNPF